MKYRAPLDPECPDVVAYMAALFVSEWPGPQSEGPKHAPGMTSKGEAAYE
jgi:hypothetical protein